MPMNDDALVRKIVQEARSSPEGTPAMSKDVEFAAKENSRSMMEDFGRLSPVETLDLDADITDDCSDPTYAEENAGA
jgi:hypothetical protein